MSGWFSKTTNVLKPEVPDAPQPFLILCRCGAEHRGFRRPAFQKILCPACGAARFVLPQDVYPVPQPTAEYREKKQEQFPATVVASEEIQEVEVVDEDVDQVEPAVSVRSKSSRKKKSAGAPPTLAELRERIRNAEKPRGDPKVAAAVPEKPGPLEGLGTTIGELGRDAGQEFVRFWSPFRILSLVMLVVIVFTAGWMVHQSLLSSAARVAQRESDLGLAAIEKEEWMVAREHLQLAAAALDRLGRTDPDAQTVRQYARETQVQYRLCDSPLEELLAKAQVELAARDPKKKGANRNLLSAYQGDWMLFEGLVRDIAPEKSKKRDYVIHVPVGDAGGTTIRMNFPVLDQLIPAGGQKQTIVAGAIAGCELDEAGHWVITLDPESGFLWTHMNTYRAIGFQFNPLRTQTAVAAELQEQADVMGVPR